jgi:hypothetical protein
MTGNMVDCCKPDHVNEIVSLYYSSLSRVTSFLTLHTLALLAPFVNHPSIFLLISSLFLSFPHFLSPFGIFLFIYLEHILFLSLRLFVYL